MKTNVQFAQLGRWLLDRGDQLGAVFLIALLVTLLELSVVYLRL